MAFFFALHEKKSSRIENKKSIRRLNRHIKIDFKIDKSTEKNRFKSPISTMRFKCI